VVGLWLARRVKDCVGGVTRGAVPGHTVMMGDHLPFLSARSFGS